MTIRGNYIHDNNGVGVGIGSDAQTNLLLEFNTIANHSLEGWGNSAVGLNVVARYNNFVNNLAAIAYYQYPSSLDIDAENNWWGSVHGPADSAGTTEVASGDLDPGTANLLNAEPAGLLGNPVGGDTPEQIDYFAWSLIPFYTAIDHVIVDAGWASKADGEIVDFGGLGYMIGFNAFDTISEGIAGVADNGTVNVMTGSYTETVDATAKAVTLAAGSSPGQVTIDGDFVLDSDDTLEVELTGTGATDFDQWIVTGTATLGNATLDLVVDYTPANGDTFEIIAGTVSGEFAGLSDGVEVGTTNFIIDYSSVTLTFDTAAPTAIIDVPDTLVVLDDTDVGSATFYFTVSYSEPMDTSVAPELTFTPSVAGTLTLNAASGWNSAGTVYTAYYDVADAGVQIVGVQIGASGAKDVAGNVQTTVQLENAFTIDTKNPTISSVTADPTLINDSVSELTVTVVFSEVMLSSTTPVLAFGPDISALLSFQSDSWSDFDTYQVVYTVATSDVTELDVDVLVSGSKDSAGNDQSGTHTEFDVFDVDTFSPSVSSVSVETDPITDGDLIQEVTVNFDEAMLTGGSANPVISFGGTAGIWSSNSNGTWVSPTQWTESFTVTDAGETVTGVTIAVSDTKDVVGNDQTAYTPEAKFDVDTKNPTVLSVAVNDTVLSDPDVGAQMLQVTVVFSEAMNPSAVPTLVLSPDVSTTLTFNSGSWTASDTYVAFYDVADAGVDVPSVTIDVEDAEDAVGNAQEDYTPEPEFAIDTENPTVLSVDLPLDGLYPMGSPLFFTVRWTEPVDLTGALSQLRFRFYADDLSPPAATRNANLFSGDTTSELTFRYLVLATDLDLDGIVQRDLWLASTATPPATLTDLNGNVAFTNTLALPPLDMSGILLDGVKPVAPGVSLTTDTGIDGDLYTSLPELTLTDVEDDATVEYSLDGGSTWGAYLPQEGLNEVLVRQIDLAGNVGPSGSLTFTLDTDAAAPGVALETDTGIYDDDFITNDATLTVTGVEDDATVEYSLDDGATWGAYSPVEGSNTVLVRQIDLAGNQSGDSAPLTFTLDTQGPTGTYTRDDASPTNADAVNFTVNFNEAAYTVDSGDFELALTRTASGTMGTVTGSGSTYSVPVSSVAGDGDLDLALASAPTMTDVAGNPVVSLTGDAYTIDNTAPVVSLITVNDNLLTGYDIDAAQPYFTVTVDYNEPMSGTAPDIAFAPDVLGPDSTLRFDSGSWIGNSYVASYTVAYRNVGGDPLGIVISGVSITATGAVDVAGNSQVAAGSKTNAFSIDTVRPLITDVEFSDSLITDADFPGDFTVTVTFDSPMRTDVYPILTFSQDLTGTLGDRTHSWTSNTTYVATYPILDVAGVTLSDITVDVSASKDAAGNLQFPDPATSVNSFDVDTKNPVGTIVVSDSLVNDADDTFTVTVTYDEPMDTDVAPSIAFSPDLVAGGTLTLDSGAWSVIGGADVYTFSYTIADLDQPAAIVGVQVTGAKDVEGNPQDLASAQFGVDMDAPTVAITDDESGTANIAGGTIEYTFTFSEPVWGFTVDDVVVANGSKAASFATGVAGDSVYTLIVTPAADFEGDLTVDVAADVAEDEAGNPNTAATQSVQDVDTLAPTVEITDDEPGTANITGGTIEYTFTFSQPVWGFTVAEVVVVGGSKASGFATGADGDAVYTLLVTPDADFEGTLTVNVAADVAKDDAENPNTAATESTQAVDTLAPAVSSVTVAPDTLLKIGDTTTVTIVFTQAIDTATFTLADLTAENGTLSNLETADNVTWTAILAPVSGVQNDTTNLVDVIDDSYADPAGNTGSGATSNNYTVDTVAPSVVSITVSDPSLIIGETATVTIVFSEAIDPATFALIDDMTAESGALTNLQTTDNITWTATFTPAANIQDTVNNVTLKGGGYTDLAGNPGTGGTSNPYAVDTIKPALTITDPVSGTANIATGPITYTFTFSEPVTGFIAGDVTVTGGTKGTFAGSGSVYTLVVTPTANFEGNLTVAVAAGKANDLAGNPNTAAVTNTQAVDTLAPTVTITDDEGGTANIAGGTILYTFTFSQPVTGFVAADVTVVNGAKGTFTAVSTTEYTLVVTPTANFQGTLTVDVPANVATDTAGNGNTAAAQNTQPVDTKRPTVTITDPVAGTANIATGAITYMFTFSESVTGFAVGDVDVTNGTKGAFGGSGSVYTLVVTPNANFEGNLTVAVAASKANDLAGNPNTAATTNTQPVDTKAPTVLSITYSDQALKIGETATVTIVFSQPIDNSTLSLADLAPDLEADNGTLTNLVPATSPYSSTFTCTLTPLSGIEDAENYVRVVAGNYTDPNGNPGGGGSGPDLVPPDTFPAYAVDTLAPAVSSITVIDDELTIGETSTVVIAFTQAINPDTFSLADLAAENGVLSDLTTSDNTNWQATLTPNAGVQDTTNVVTLTGSYQDPAGNAGTGGTSNNYQIDLVTPSVVSVLLSDYVLNSLDVATVTITFSEPVADFDNSDVTADSGTLGTLTTADNIVWTATLTPPATTDDATNVVTVANTYTDALGNPASVGGVSDNYEVDTVAPTVVSIVLDDSELNIGDTATVTIEFSEAVTGLAAVDFTTPDGTLSEPATTDGGITWTATLTPIFDRESWNNVVTLPAGSYTDLAGNLGGEGSSETSGFYYEVDTRAPTVVEIYVDPSGIATITDAHDGLFFSVFVLYSEPMNHSFVPSLTFSPDVTSTLTVTAIGWSGGEGNSIYEFECEISDANVDVPDVDGTVSGGQDLFGNPVASVTMVDAFDIDTLNPIPSVSVDTPLITDNDFEQVVTIDFPEPMQTSGADPVISFSAGTWTSSGDGAWNLDGNQWIETFTVTDAGQEVTGVTIGVTGTKDANGNDQAAYEPEDEFDLDTLNPTVDSIVTGSTPTNAASVTFTVTFSEQVSDVDAGDFALDTSGVTGAAIDSVTGSGALYTVTVLTGTGDGTIGLNLVDNDTIVDDPAGNDLVVDGDTFEGDVYTIDKTPPAGTAILYSDFLVTDEDVGPAAFWVEVTYNEPMGSLAPTLEFIPPVPGTMVPDTDPAAPNSGWVDADTYRAYYNVADNNEWVAGLKVRATGAQDEAGNEQPPLELPNTITIDTRNPSVLAAGGVDVSDTLLTDSDAGPGRTFVVTVKFDEQMSTGLAPTLAFDPALATTLTFNAGASSWRGDNLTFDAVFAVADDNVLATGVNVSVSDARDSAGNLQVPFTTTTGPFSVDMANPTVTAITRTAGEYTNAASVEFTVTFSETVTGVDAGDFVLAAAGVSGATIDAVSGDGATYTVTVLTGSGDGTLGLDLVNNGTITDDGGNTLDGTAIGEVYQVDKTLPTIIAAVTTSPNGAGWYNANVTVEFTTADPVVGGVSSGINLATDPADEVLSSEGANISSSAQTVEDNAGNVSDPSNVVTVNIDKTDPATTAAVTAGTVGTNGWYRSDVTVTLSPDDVLSGVAETYYNVDGGAQQSGTEVIVTGEGVQTIVYWSVDVADNTETAKTLEIKIDTETTVGIDDPLMIDNIVSGSEDDAVVISGTAEAGATVQVTVSDTGTGTITVTVSADGSGVWTTAGLDLTTFADGDLGIDVTSTDEAGNTATDSKTITKDTVTTVTIAETLEIDNVVNGAEAATVVISGTAEAGTAEAGATVEVTVTDTATPTANTITVTAVNVAGVWTTADLDLSGFVDGGLLIEVTSMDGVGNTASTSKTISKDTTTYVAIDTTLEIDNVVNAAEAGTVVISGTAEAEAAVQVTVTDTGTGTITVTVVADGSGVWTTAGLDLTAFADGDLEIDVTSTDAALNTATASKTIAKDTVSTVTIADPLESDNVVNAAEDDTVVISGTAEAGALVQVTVSDSGSGSETVTVVADGLGAWTTADLDLSAFADGVLHIDVTSTDVALNTGTASTTISKDAASPTVDSVEVSDPLITDVDTTGTFTVTVVFSEAMDAVDPTLTFDPDVTGTLVSFTDSWTDSQTYVAVYTLADAGVDVPAVQIGVSGAQDAAGNAQQAYTPENEFVIDTENPVVTVLSGPATATEGDPGYTFTATNPGGGVMSLVAGSPSAGAGNAVTNVVFDGTTGTGSFDVTFPDGPSSPTVSVQVQDANGNLSNLATLEVTVENVPPTLEISGAASVNEGATYTLNLSSSDPGDDTISSWTINWGDGAPEVVTGNPATATHVYADGANSYEISATATDEDGTYAAGDTVSVTVANVAPTIDFATSATSVNEGATYTLELDAVIDPGTDTVASYVINWGDGTTPEPFSGSPAGLTKTHVFVDGPAVRTISVTLTDEDDTHSSSPSTHTVTVNNVNPTGTFVNAGAVSQGTAGFVQFTAYGDASSADQATLRFAYDFNNDGTFDSGNGTWAGSFGVAASTAVPGSYLTAVGSRTIKGRIMDDDGGYTDFTTAITVNNVIPIVTAGPDAINVGAGMPFTRVGSFTDPGSDTWTATVDYGAGDGAVPLTLNPDKTFNLSHTYATAGTYTVTVTVDDGNPGGIGSDDFTVEVVNQTFQVTSFTATPSGFDLTFNRAPDTSVLNLYSGSNNNLGDPDLVVTDGSGATVRGSLIWNPGTNTAHFVKTGMAPRGTSVGPTGLLAVGTYNVTLVSGATAWKDGSGQLLDGDNDGNAGGNWQQGFTVTPSDARILSLPDFARGPTQALDVHVNGTAIATGLPVRISNASNVTSVTFALNYDPTQLTITSVELAAGMPADWEVQPVYASGKVVVTLFGVTPLTSTNAQTLALLRGSVPASAAPGTARYGGAELLRFSDIEVTNALAEPVDTVGDDAVHKVVYFGDVDNNFRLQGLDATFISRYVSQVILQPNAGFPAHPLTDPLIVGNVTGSGRMTGTDSTYVAQKVANLLINPGVIPQIPIPGPSTGTIRAIVDPTVQVGEMNTVAQAGQAVPTSIRITDSAAGVLTGEFTIRYDTALLDLKASDIRLSSYMTGMGWAVAKSVDDSQGLASILIYGGTELPAGRPELLQLMFQASADTAGGISPLDIEGCLNGGYLIMTPVDGQIIVMPSRWAAGTAGAALAAANSVSTPAYPRGNPVQPAGLAEALAAVTQKAAASAEAAVRWPAVGNDVAGLLAADRAAKPRRAEAWDAALTEVLGGLDLDVL